MQEITVDIPVKGGKTRQVKAELLKLKVWDLVPYEGNAKEHPQSQIDYIIGSIRNSGFRSPIEVDENNVILAGHGRREACMQIGIKEVPVIRYKDLTESEKTSYRIDTNRTADFGQLSVEKLQLEFEKIELQDYQMDMYDFAIPDIEVWEMPVPSSMGQPETGQIEKYDKELYSAQQDDVEDIDDIEAELTKVQTLDTDKNVVRGIQIPVSQEIYDETFKEFRKLLDSGANVWELFFNLCKDENAKNQ